MRQASIVGEEDAGLAPPSSSGSSSGSGGQSVQAPSGFDMDDYVLKLILKERLRLNT